MSGFKGWPAELRSGAERRGERRLPVEIAGAFLREPGYSRAAVTVRDLSLRGFRTEWPYRLRPGAMLWLTLPGLHPMPATVAWAMSFEIGCLFNRALHPAVFDTLVRPFHEAMAPMEATLRDLGDRTRRV